MAVGLRSLPSPVPGARDGIRPSSVKPPGPVLGLEGEGRRSLLHSELHSLLRRKRAFLSLSDVPPGEVAGFGLRTKS